MRQHVQKRLISVSPYNQNPLWPDGYFDVLQDAGVHEDSFLIYANCVRDLFKNNPGKARLSLGANEIRAYLQQLENSGAVEVAGRLQAREALILYYEKFRGIPLVKRQHDDTVTKKNEPSENLRIVSQSNPHTPSHHLDWTALKTA